MAHQLEDGHLVVEDDIEEGARHVDATVVLQETELPEPIHEESLHSKELSGRTRLLLFDKVHGPSFTMIFLTRSH